MSELRQDRTTGEWVIIAPQRGERLRHARAQPLPIRGTTRAVTGRYDRNCPFCPGNEGQLPGIVEEIPVDRPPGWQVRVVPNKYPAVGQVPWPTDGTARSPRAHGAGGAHEVIIESPRHDADLPSMSDEEINAVLRAYRRRFALLLARSDIQAVILYRNRGQASGASLSHPHAQLVALTITPPWLNSTTDWASRYHRQHARCVICDELATERNVDARMIEETEIFCALVPFAATVPCEVWLIPKPHKASFAEVDDNELAELGPLLRRVLRRLDIMHTDPPYNLVVNSACKSQIHAPHLHWHLRIRPNLVAWGGFELGTRMPINPSSPEEDAARLRSVSL